ncbi:hypothetical protein QYF36_008824 [Acer negundo]|nr:hypothetical protein QYF36_008824 [Acer negundo]
MKIHVEKSSIVRPALAIPEKKLWNSNLDLLVPTVHISTVYFYRQLPNDSSNFFDPRILKKALSCALVQFFPMAGRLGLDENGRLEIWCNGDGVLFVEADLNDVTFDDLEDFTPSLKLQELLVPTVDYSKDIYSHPLLLLQVTRFKCGGVCLGVGLHHTLSDGSSAIHFINTWAEWTRGVSISIPPYIDRTVLRLGVPPYPTFDHIEYDPPPAMKTSTKTVELQSSPCSTAILKLSVDQINALKSKSKPDHGTTIRYSTYEILAAHIWRCMCKARGLSDDQTSKLYMPIDGRSRLNPPLPYGYMGNVLFSCTSILKSGDIQSQPLISIVKKVHEALKKMDDEYLKSALAFIEQQPDLTVLKRGAHTFKCPNLNVVSWMRLPIYDSDFGWGSPIYMGPASVIFEGMVYILPNPIKNGSFSLALCLETNHMQIFKKCLYDF